MLQNVLVGIMCAIVACGGFIAWRMERSGPSAGDEEKENDGEDHDLQ